jgi:hypothetical protein
MPVRVLPKILTVQDWNAKKGTIAKMAGETGIGAALAKLKTEWDKVPWNILDPDAAMSAAGKGRQSVALLDQCMKAAQSNIGKLEPVRKQLSVIEKLAQKIEADWQKNKLIPASSRKHVGTMKVDAEKFSIALKSVDNDWLNRRKQLVADEARMKGIARSALNNQIASIKKFAVDVRKTPTVVAYMGQGTTGFNQSVRGLNASLARMQDPAIVDWKDKNWNALAAQDFWPKQDAEVDRKVATVLQKLKELEGLLA